MPPQLTPFYRPLTRLAESQLFVQILRLTFNRFVRASRWSSEPLLHRALFLCGIALNEQQRRDEERAEALAHQRAATAPFRFIEHAESEGIGALLVQLESRIDNAFFGDLLTWTQRQYREALERQRGSSDCARSQQSSAQSVATKSATMSKSERSKIAEQKRQAALERVSAATCGRQMACKRCLPADEAPPTIVQNSTSSLSLRRAAAKDGAHKNDGLEDRRAKAPSGARARECGCGRATKNNPRNTVLLCQLAKPLRKLITWS